MHGFVKATDVKPVRGYLQTRQVWRQNRGTVQSHRSQRQEILGQCQCFETRLSSRVRDHTNTQTYQNELQNKFPRVSCQNNPRVNLIQLWRIVFRYSILSRDTETTDVFSSSILPWILEHLMFLVTVSCPCVLENLHCVPHNRGHERHM